MSLLLSVIFATRCRSMHHRMALEALRFLKGPHAAAWRGLLLHHHEQYLKGSKAPDDVFKDYKNHVLHVREGEWGGAIEAAQEWRKRTVRAMKDKDWSHVAWCAGVMSHYVVDPCQPFHTHQTEEENVIHRAAEYSFYASYAALRALLERELGGFPDIALSNGNDWVADIVRQGARASNQVYETVVDHYNFAAAVKRAEDGLDHELRRAIAPLIGRAVMSWARAFDRMCAESEVKPPRLAGGMQALFLALEGPIQSMLGAAADGRERAQVAAQYEEYRKTGKVRTTLSEDDATVRALHAAEVLKVPLSSLDARWPREIGTAYKAGRPKRTRTAKAKTRAKPAQAPAASSIRPAPPADLAPARSAPDMGPASAPAQVKAAAGPAAAATGSQQRPPASTSKAQPASKSKGAPAPARPQAAQPPPPPAQPSSPFFNPAAPVATVAPAAQPPAKPKGAAAQSPPNQQPASQAPPKDPVSSSPAPPPQAKPEPATWMKGTRQPSSDGQQPQAKPETATRQAPAKPAQKAEAAPSRTAEVIDSTPASTRGERQPAEPADPPLLLTKKVVDKKKRKKGGDDEIYTLKGTSPIVEAPSIGSKMARRFQSMGVRTVSDLLALSPATAAVLLDVRNVSAPDIADWQVQAVLACTVPDLIHREAQAVVACGVRSVEDLAQADAKQLADSMRDWAKEQDGGRAWGGGAAPGVADAESLIERAQAVVSKRPKSAA